MEQLRDNIGPCRFPAETPRRILGSMITIVVLVVIAASAIWVYNDARSLGVTRQAGGFLAASPGGWAAITLLLWIVGLPLYLAMRPEFKRRRLTQAIPPA